MLNALFDLLMCLRFSTTDSGFSKNIPALYVIPMAGERKRVYQRTAVVVNTEYGFPRSVVFY